MALLPIMIMLMATNVIIRSESFYSFFISRSEVIKEIPYEIEADDIKDTFCDFMLHKKADFQLKEKSDYQPQEVFSQRDDEVMKGIRKIVDIMFIAGVFLFLICVTIAVYLILRGEKKLLYESFRTSWIWFGVIIIVNAVIDFVPIVKEVIFKAMFGVRFPPGDVLIQIFDVKFMVYYGVFQLVFAMLIMGVIMYILNRYVNSHKMF